MYLKHIKQNVINIILIMVLTTSQCEGMGFTEKRQLREKVLEMFNHAYENYMEHAYPADELMPLSCQGRYRDRQHSRGDIDDALGNFSLTLVDTLDTLVVLGQLDKFDEAVRLVIRDVSFDKDIVVSVFETNIRMLGGLLGGHVMAEELKRQKARMQWYKGELLDLAVDLGDRLLPAFNTSTGIPFPKVNLRHGFKPTLSRTGHEKDTCTACAGTMILEFAALSRLTGNMVYEEKAHKAMEYLWMSRHRSSDLVGTVINIHNGDWVRRESGIGAGIDSYYEYMLKAYVLLGDETYLTRFNKHYAAVMKYISQGPMMLDVHMHRPLRSSRNFMDALFAFWPGLQVLKGDIKPAIEIHEMLYQVTQIHNFLPEAFTTDFRIHWAHHPLRPEFIESTYFIHKATSDPYYLQVGKTIINNLETYARVECGFAAIKNVYTNALEDQMDSYVMAETFKYLYLLFSEKEDIVIDVDKYVFTTEAHLLPLSLSLHPINNTKAGSGRSVYSDDDSNHDRSCPNTNSMSRTTVHYAQNLRSPLKNLVRNHCVKPAVKTRKQRLHAADFVAGRSDHLEELKKMGIHIVTVSDGRVQLLHTASEAASEEDASDGLLFMQEMIELSKAENAESQYEQRVVQIVSPPYLGSMTLTAGPAQFGPDLKNTNGIEGKLVKTDPFTACEELTTDVSGHVALVQRGACMFIDKARILQKAGAVGAIVLDNNDGSSSQGSPLFAMSGDGKSDVSIPMVFLFQKEGAVLEKGLAEYSTISVLLADKARKPEDIAKETILRQAGSLMGEVKMTKTAADGDVNTDQWIYFASFDDVRLEVRSQTIISVSTMGNVGTIQVSLNSESDLPTVHLEQLEDTYKRRVTSGKIARLLHGFASFSKLSENEYSDHLYALGKLTQAIFTDDEISGSASMETLLNKLSTDEVTDVDMANNDGLTERKEQLLKRINTLLSGYVSKQLREMFPNNGGIIAEVSVEISGQRRLGLADPSNWVVLARFGSEMPPVCAVSGPPLVQHPRYSCQTGVDTSGAPNTPTERGTDSTTQGPLDVNLVDEEVTFTDIAQEEALSPSEKLEQHQLQLKQQQLLLWKQYQQQQQQQQQQREDMNTISSRVSIETSGTSTLSDSKKPNYEYDGSDSDISKQSNDDES